MTCSRGKALARRKKKKNKGRKYYSLVIFSTYEMATITFYECITQLCISRFNRITLHRKFHKHIIRRNRLGFFSDFAVFTRAIWHKYSVIMKQFNILPTLLFSWSRRFATLIFVLIKKNCTIVYIYILVNRSNHSSVVRCNDVGYSWKKK